MAITTAELTVLFSGRATEAIRKAAFFPRLLNRTWEPELQNARATKIPKFDIGSPGDITEYVRGANWKDADEVDYALQDFVLDKHWEIAHKIDFLDQIESELNLVMEQADAQGYQRGQQMDAYSWGVVTGGMAATNTLAPFTAHNLSKATYSDPNLYNAVFETVEMLIAELLGTNLTGPDSVSGDEPWILMHTTPFLAFLKAMQSYKLPIEPINVEAFTEGRAGGGGMPFSARHWNVNILSSNSFAPINLAGSKTAYPITAITDRYGTFAARPLLSQFLTPQTNQTGPFYMLRSILTAATKVVDQNRGFMRTVQATGSN